MPEPDHGAGTPPGGQGYDPEAAWKALRDGLGAVGDQTAHGDTQCLELCPICRAADVLRATGPPELRGQFNEFQREALVTLRTLLDHYIERLDQPDPEGPRVEEIPID